MFEKKFKLPPLDELLILALSDEQKKIYSPPKIQPEIWPVKPLPPEWTTGRLDLQNKWNFTDHSILDKGGRIGSKFFYLDLPGHTHYISQEIRKEPVSRNSSQFFEAQALIMSSSDLGLARLLSQFQNGELEPEFGVHLAHYLKQGAMQDLSQYALKTDSRNEYGFGVIFPERYYDGRYNFCLMHNQELVASIGFNADRSGGIIITQIQGSKGHSDALKPIKWERALVDYVVNWAHKHKIPKVTVQSAANNFWGKHRSEQVLTSESLEGKSTITFLDQLRMLYDVTAKRCGFKLADEGNYVKIIC